ncbi:MAG: site-specific integrase [Planctomycetes bacterium]|nr:site-specific integrase [Planctomycetota bacterium]
MPGYTDKKLSEELDRKIQKLVSFRSMNQSPDADLLGWLESLPREQLRRLARFELLQSAAAEGAKPVAEHVADYSRFLTSDNQSDRYVKESTARVTAIVKGCRFMFLSDISAAKVVDFLKARRDVGMGLTTSNHYLTALKGFCNWMVRERRISESPVGHLRKLNTKTDVRRERRHLPAEEFARLLSVARNGESMLGLSGRDREMLYLTAGFTGLRASELGSLTVSSFDFASDVPTVTVEAAYSKHRRRDVLPVHPDLAVQLRGWLAEREAGRPDVLSIDGNDDASERRLWPGRWAIDRRAAQMLRGDLEVAGIPYVDDSGKVFDFHALRHQFISMLAAAGVHVKTAQELARHSDINLTMNAYTHVGLRDLNSAVESLPSLPTTEAAELKATGTDGAKSMHKGMHKLSANQCLSVPLSANNADGESVAGTITGAAKNPGKHGENHVSSGSNESENQGWLRGLEPPPSGT